MAGGGRGSIRLVDRQAPAQGSLGLRQAALPDERQTGRMFGGALIVRAASARRRHDYERC
jgi:hypothetical protein